MQASSAVFMSLHQLSADSSDDNGGGDSSGAHCSMTAQNRSRNMDMAGSSRMDSSRMDNNHIGKPDNQIRLRLLQRRPLSERLNAGRAQKVIQLPPMQ
jgi:hypothetical protein